MDSHKLPAQNQVEVSSNGEQDALSLCLPSPPESDPLLTQKMHLLCQRNLGLEFQVPNSLSLEVQLGTLNKMVQVARILHLTETEMYFIEDGEIGICSPRNELESLNSILLMVNSLKPGVEDARKKVLHVFEDAVLHMISSVGVSEFNDMTSDEYECKAEELLLKWGMDNGVTTKLKISYFKEAGRGAMASEDMDVGDTALEIPESLIICEDVLYGSDMHLRKQYDELCPALCSRYPEVFPPELYTWNHFLWACELWYSNSMKVIFSDGKLKTCLVPIAGFLNHSSYPHILHYGRVDLESHTLKFRLSSPCRAGKQCYLYYGSYPSSHFITFYGFMPKGDNPYDVIPLDFDDPDGCDQKSPNHKKDWTTHIIRGTWLSGNKISPYLGIPSSLFLQLATLINDAKAKQLPELPQLVDV